MKRLACGLLVLVGCSGPSPHATCPPPASIAALAPHPVVAVDIAPTSDERAIVAWIADEAGRARVDVAEWDVPTMRTVPGSTRTVVKPDDSEPRSIGVASLDGTTFVATTSGRAVTVAATNDAPSFYANGYAGSIAAGHGRVFVASYESDCPRSTKLTLRALDPKTLLERGTSSFPVTACSSIGDRPRYRTVALGSNSAYVVVESSGGTPDAAARVVSVDPLSLREVASYSLPGHAGENAQVAVRDDHVFVLARGTVTELTSDLRPVRAEPLATDDFAVGRDRAFLGSSGLTPNGSRWDVVPAIGKRASCTPTWIGDAALLACAIDLAPPVAVRLR